MQKNCCYRLWRQEFQQGPYHQGNHQSQADIYRGGKNMPNAWLPAIRNYQHQPVWPDWWQRYAWYRNFVCKRQQQRSCFELRFVRKAESRSMPCFPPVSQASSIVCGWGVAITVTWPIPQNSISVQMALLFVATDQTIWKYMELSTTTAKGSEMVLIAGSCAIPSTNNFQNQLE